MPIMELREMLLKKEQELEKLVQIVEKHADSPLPGTLQISMIKGKPRYYHCYLDKNGNKQLKYLSAVKEGPKIMELAQHSYNAAFLKTATDQLKAVRSKSEKIIADKYYERGIPYKYEKPLLLKKQAKTITIRPDFTTLNKRTRMQRYHEHFGKMDDPQYARKALEKIRLYENNGIFIGEQLILTFESSEQPLDNREFELLIEKYLI